MKTGRNDPCPCGSGLKYKKCCADKQDVSEHQRVMGSIMGELKELLKDQSFGSLDEANAFLRQHMPQRNQVAVDDFHGLSSEQMHRFLYFPFETPNLVSFPSSLDSDPRIPILSLFKLLADAIGEGGLKATATGNLPRSFCRESARTFLGEEEYQRWSRYGELRSEPDFREMHTTRLVAGLAGLIRKYKGKFILSKDCRKLLAEQGQPASTRACFGPLSESTTGPITIIWEKFPSSSNRFCSASICWPGTAVSGELVEKRFFYVEIFGHGHLTNCSSQR